MHLIMQQHLLQVAEHTNTPTSSRRVALTQQGSPLPISTLGPAFSTTCRLPATTHCPAQPAHPQAHPSSHIRRARRPGATTDQKLALCPTQWSPPSTSSCQSSTQGPCRLGRAQQRAEELLLGPESTPSRSKSARGEFAIRRRSHSPAPSTCSTATHRSIQLVAPGAR